MTEYTRITAVETLLAAAESAGEADTVNGPHIARLHDPETGAAGDAFYGPYVDPVHVARDADTIVGRLNKGLSANETRFSAHIHPLRSTRR